jgi:hypothetical protein
MRSTAGGIGLIPMFLGGQESGLGGTAWLGEEANMWTAMVCVFSGVEEFLAEKPRVE